VNTERSESLFLRLAKVMPGANTRSVTHYEPFPIALDRGEGCRIWDLDGRSYIDYVNNYTPLVHGHAHPRITEAIASTAARGTVFPATTVLQAELAERICGRNPRHEQVRFANSGTEAVMMAVRGARALTDRDELIMPYGGYHGSWDQVSTERGHTADGPGNQTAGAARGIPAVLHNLVHFVKYNDVGHLEELMARHGSKVAAVILEPVIGTSLAVGDPEFVRAARRLTQDHGSMLILDEVVTYRLHVGGWQAQHGIEADLTTMGKTIGGGLPVGAFGGREDIMRIFDPRISDSVPAHGTFNGNSLTMAAGCASLDLLDQTAIDRINDMGATLRQQMEDAVSAVDADVSVTNVGSLLHVHSPKLQALHRACLEEGLFIAPRGSMNLSTVMDEAIMQETVASWKRALQRVEWAETERTLASSPASAHSWGARAPH
jgi:glutamate-1-semialdehyde 2,1-aminomutase